MNTESIKTIKDFKTLAHFLAEELSWPIDPDNVDVESLTFEYQPEDIGLSEEFAAKVQTIKQIRPLDANQPWSIFWIDFENKKLPLTVLRRILNVFVTKKRGNTRNIATKDMEDIMFVSGHGEDRNSAITFAHFKRLDDVETIREFYWDCHETKFDHIASYLEKLEWPSNTSDVEGWRKSWKAAFTGSTREAITTSDQLAKSMANIAKNIRDRVLEVLYVERKNGPVHKLYESFRTGLVHDMTEKGFADMYAQTITYGLFSARTMDTDGHFELHEVIDLIPSTNPFLKNLFRECLKTGDTKHKIDLDELGVGRLIDLFDNLNRSDGTDAMQRILAEFGRQTFSGQEDPVIHFYEGFLCEYDNIQRVDQGVYYTPDPVVSFIVRSVNEQLKSEFGLEMGLADTTTWSEMVSSGRAEFPPDPNTGKVNKEWIDKIKGRAFVQILDPATGTATFLKHVIELIHEEVQIKYKKEHPKVSWIDHWNKYVYNSLLPRIYGFELMMASYSVAHMKLGMFLKSTGYKFEKEQRLNIFLTNSLEPFTANNSANLFFTSVGAESAGANEVKKNRYFSVILGNPPYSVESSNKSAWLMNLLEDYKQEPDGKGKLNERNPKMINDDYVKFLRYGQYLIEKNGLGILAFINPHGFLDNTTYRGMRWDLLRAYSELYFIDLHGNSRKKEISPDGSSDANVFDIMQGVSINFFLKNKTRKKNELGKIFHFDLFGKRDFKYDFLKTNSYKSIDYVELQNVSPNYFFVPKDYGVNATYNLGFSLNEFYLINSVGITTSNDSILINKDSIGLLNNVSEFYSIEIDNDLVYQFPYRPFDYQKIYYDVKIIARAREKVMRHFLKFNNLGLAFEKIVSINKPDYSDILVVNSIVDKHTLGGASYLAPIYLYNYNKNQRDVFETKDRIPNVNIEIVNKIASIINLDFKDEKETMEKNSFSPIDILDYIYAVLYSPRYREKYRDFLKTDFPRVPYPKDQNTFWRLVNLGSEMRQIHLLESSKENDPIIEFPVLGLNDIPKAPEYKNNRVYINKAQFFDGVSEIAWNFYIGGYQPAQKWLKDRKGRTLTNEDITHYQKIIVTLTETDRIMKEIAQIDFIERELITDYPTQDNDFQFAADSGL